MAGREVDRHPRCDLAVTVVKHDAAAMTSRTKPSRRPPRTCRGRKRDAYAPGRERRLPVMNVQCGRGKQVGVAEIAVMEVRGNQRFYRLRLDAQRS